jgi:hypothetical protein
MTVHRLGFPVQNTADIVAANITGNTQLSFDGASTAVLNPDGAYSIALPDPTECDGMIREIVNKTAFALTVRQYNNGAFLGAEIALPGVALGTLQTGTSVAVSAGITPAITTASGTPKYASARYYCNGSTWSLLTATPNPIF